MLRERVCRIIMGTILATLAQTALVLAHGDKVIPQVAEGKSGGLSFRTKFDIINLSDRQRITKVKLLFFKQDGTAWPVASNQGTVSEITLSLGYCQTIRIETLGTTTTLTAGYAIVRNMETTSSTYSDDFEVGISVFYEILSGSDVVDTISVPVGQPTLAWIIPVETSDTKQLYSGFAIVNLADISNKVTLTLLEATTPSSSDATLGPQVTLTLNANEQKARFLNESGLFPTKTTFKGMLVGFSEKPVSILALLQTTTPTGVQYATLVPSYLDTLRRNTFIYLPQGFFLDADIPIADYNYDEVSVIPKEYDDYTWDLAYQTQSNTTRRLLPRSGAMLANIGSRTTRQFSDLSLQDTQGFTYKASPDGNIDMSDLSTNLASGFTFAIKTKLGRYAKCQVFQVITSTDSAGNTYKELALLVHVFR